KILEEYEKKLHLYSTYVVRKEYLEQLKQYIQETYPKDSEIKNYIEQIQEIDE
ncbi:putative DNA-binding protein, partial [Enterococcus faecalis]